MIRVCLAGVTGWIGQPLRATIEASEDIELVAAVSRKAAGSTVGGVAVSATVRDALRTPFDVLVDYTSADVVKSNVLAAIDAGRHVVVGSSGMSDDDYAEIDRAARAKNVGVVAVGNFAISAALLSRFAREAAKHLPNWEIIDYAHDGKPDAPSGAARELAWHLSQVGHPKPAVAVKDTVGEPGTRGALIGTSQVHSVRLPGYTIGLEVLFGRSDERLSIRYEGGVSAEPYLNGTLMAIRRVGEFRGVVRGLDQLL
jgi:4-hydroxy-tetrahydrodipicolinate reductase